MTPSSSSSAHGTATLAQGLERRLPGLSRALDVEAAGDWLAHTLLDSDSHVAGVDVGSLWYRADGSCSLRYQVSIDRTALSSRRETVLGRVCSGPDASKRYLAATLPIADAKGPASPPWRQWVAVSADSPFVLHPFPIDADVPTLGRALDLGRVERLLKHRGGRSPRSVAVVRHNRTGSCVVRYDLSGPGQLGPGAGPRAVFGKVYGDDSGGAAYHFLRSTRAGQGAGARSRVRTPLPIHYDAASRLLLTEALPGTSALPGLVKAELARSGAGGQAGSGSLADLVTECGRALAAVHAGVDVQVPRRSLRDVAADLRSELDIVGAVWPEQAEHVGSLVEEKLRDALEPPTSVLCHGDFTPSQVLVTDGALTGIVDFDTVCWGDPALDLGRYLAHLDLVTTKVAGPHAEPLTTALAGTFIDGYLDVTAGSRPLDRTLRRRIDLYRSLSLARTALHACRQLKDDRLNLALLLLRTADHRTERVDL